MPKAHCWCCEETGETGNHAGSSDRWFSLFGPRLAECYRHGKTVHVLCQEFCFWRYKLTLKGEGEK